MPNVSSRWASKLGGSAATTKSSSPPARGRSWAGAAGPSAATRARHVRIDSNRRGPGLMDDLRKEDGAAYDITPPQRAGPPGARRVIGAGRCRRFFAPGAMDVARAGVIEFHGVGDNSSRQWTREVAPREFCARIRLNA